MDSLNSICKTKIAKYVFLIRRFNTSNFESVHLAFELDVSYVKIKISYVEVFQFFTCEMTCEIYLGSVSPF